MQIKQLERVFTRHFFPAVLASLAIAWLTFGTLLARGVDLDDASKLVDATFKIAAVIVGTGWALNRYFTARTDALQLRVDPVVDVVQPDTTKSSVGLLVCRLDIVNTGRALTPPFRKLVRISATRVEGASVEYDLLLRWPESGLHPAAPIEPGSWSAVSVAVPLIVATSVVHIYIEMQFEDRSGWTWHRHFVLQEHDHGTRSSH